MKPPYRVPSMAEIEAVSWNGYKVVSTFSGCGGSCLGFRMAGFKVVWASEFIPAARETYVANHPTIPDPRDIREVKAEEVLEKIGMTSGELDVLEGSPPCASFSTVGKREAGWRRVRKYSDAKQRTDDLFPHFARLLRGLQPKVFMAENVSGLVKGVARGYFREIIRDFQAAGYRVQATMLDAAWLGVPQHRERIIFIGVREDLNLNPVHPQPFPYQYSLRDAWPNMKFHGSLANGFRGAMRDSSVDPAPTIMTQPSLRRGVGTGIVEIERVIHDTRGKPSFSEGPIDPDGPLNTVTAGSSPDWYVEKQTEESKVRDGLALTGAVGEAWDETEIGEQSDRYFQIMKPDPDDAVPCVTAAGGTGCASVVHPTERRKFTIAELKRICAFPDDFILTGSYRQQWERLGRSVPPLMAFAIAKTIRDEILAKVRPSR